MTKAEMRAQAMGEEKIPKILIKLSLPAIVAMLINAIYNTVDAFFIGKLGTSAIGAVAVAFPIFSLIGAIGLTFGIGGASYISRSLGAGNKPEADRTTSTAFFTSLISGIIFTVLGLVLIIPLLRAFGATDTILPFAKDYTRILIMGSIFTMLNMTMNNMVRAEGNAPLSMIAMITGAVLNIGLDPIFIFTFNLGITGAAIATVISQSISTIILLTYYLSKKSYMSLSIKNLKPSKKIYSEILKIGSPSFIRNFLASFSIALINLAAKPYGDAAVAAIGLTFRVLVLGMFPLFGYAQGFQPVVGFNYGAKKFKRVFEAIRVSAIWTSVFSVAFAIVSITFAPNIISVFSNDPAVIDIGSRSLRAANLFFFLFGFQVITTVLFQALGKGLPAALLSLARQGIFLIPAVLIMPGILGLNGVIYSQPVADFLTIILTLFFAIDILRKLKKEAIALEKTEVAEYSE